MTPEGQLLAVEICPDETPCAGHIERVIEVEAAVLRAAAANTARVEELLQTDLEECVAKIDRERQRVAELEAALQAIVNKVPACANATATWQIYVIAVGALARREPPTAAALDVDRLAAAMLGMFGQWQEQPYAADYWAPRIAAEYQRLAAAPVAELDAEELHPAAEWNIAGSDR